MGSACPLKTKRDYGDKTRIDVAMLKLPRSILGWNSRIGCQWTYSEHSTWESNPESPNIFKLDGCLP
jgi:hypothetical protein